MEGYIFYVEIGISIFITFIMGYYAKTMIDRKLEEMKQ
jgi:hypothetical protein